MRRLYWRCAVRQAARGAGACRQFIDHSTLRCEAAADGGGLQMTPGRFLSFVPLLLGLFAAQPARRRAVGHPAGRAGRIILRVPVQPRPFAPQFEWIEQKGPKCIPAAAIRGALLSGPKQVDFVLANRAAFAPSSTRIARRSTSTADSTCSRRTIGLCAGRDAIHSRIGGSCTIERFKQLDPQVRAR